MNENHLNGTIPSSLGDLYLEEFIVTGTNLTCPPDNTDCGTTQYPDTSFCQT
ncbi:unnamed protein product, partial [Closterium sp. NIES-54]